jgi:hypothetical protein
MLAWDRAVRGEHGGAREGAGRPPKNSLASRPINFKSDNVTLEKHSDRKGGNSQQQGIRRLERAATSGNQKASDLLQKVTDPAAKLSVNAACIEMGWRQPTTTVRKISPLDTIKQAWARASEDQRREIAGWIAGRGKRRKGRGEIIPYNVRNSGGWVPNL